MITARVKIGEGEIEDTFAAHKLIFLEGDDKVEAPIKKRDTTTYAEEAGEHADPRTVQNAFDYKASFIVDGQSETVNSVNAIIAAFNAKLYTQEAESDIRTYKVVEFYDDDKHHKIVGLPEPIAEIKTLERSTSGYEFAQVEWSIRVSDPTKCIFNYLSEE